MVNTLNVQAGEAVVTAPPEVAAFGIFPAAGLTATVDAEAGTLSLSVDGVHNDLVPDGYIAEATSPKSAGRRNSNRAFRVMTGKAAIANLGGARSTLGQAYQSRLGLPLVGDRVNVRVSQLKDGQRTPGQTFTAIVAAA